jgi:hypothetical protein
MATVQSYPADAADECIAKPTATTSGKHWFYRIDRATKRQCWYLRDGEPSQGASLEVRKSAAAASHKAHAAFSPSAANARAELPQPSAPRDDDVKVATAAAASAASPAATTSAAALPAMASAAPTADIGAAAQQLPDSGAGAVDQSAVATRWPDPNDLAAPVAAPSRAPSFAVASATPSPNANTETITPATAAQLSVGETEAPAKSSLMGADDSARTRLFMFLGAVALVGFSSSVLLARARARRRIRLAPAVARRATRWPAEPAIDRMRLPTVDAYYPALISTGEPGSRRAVRPSIIPRDDEARDEQFEVEQMLARYAGQPRRER